MPVSQVIVRLQPSLFRGKHRNGQPRCCHLLVCIICLLILCVLHSSPLPSTMTNSPLDVLMVWHSFMLNPRDYYEDCIKFGLKDLWATGMPWVTVNEAIDNDFNYHVPENGQREFVELTGHQWDNGDDSLIKIIQCPACNKLTEVPWTTCMANSALE